MSKKLHDATLAKWRTRELALMDDLVPLLNQRAKLDALQDHRKGLLQQLFPNPELSKK